MITVVGKATSNEQASSFITDLKNRDLIAGGFIYHPHLYTDYENLVIKNYNDNIPNVNYTNKITNQWLEANKYVVLLRLHPECPDNYKIIEKLATEIHGINELVKI